jgi:hypothetical protein
MKLRIRGNSIRLRLTQSEVAQFIETGKVEERVEFAPNTPILRYRLETAPDGNDLRAIFEENCLRVLVTQRAAEKWASSEQVGIKAAQILDNERSLRILIEKDFACLTARESEDETDAFPHPMAAETF